MGPPFDSTEPDPEFDDGLTGEAGFDDAGPAYAWLPPPDDRLWRHPSESWAATFQSQQTDLAQHSLVGRLASNEWGRFVVTGVVAGLVAALVVSGLATAEGWWGGRTIVSPAGGVASSVVSLATQGSSTSGAGGADWTSVDDMTVPSVMAITVSGAGGPQQGSGVVLASYSGRSYLATDLSLFAPGEAAGYVGAVALTTMAGQTVSARLVGEDKAEGIAIVEFSSLPGLPPALTGSVADIREASTLLAVGARSSSSLGLGVVSSTDRAVDVADGDPMYDLVEMSTLPLSAAGRGSPLVDSFGQVVAITVSVDATASSDQQATFAVPIDKAARATREIVDGLRISQPWIGATNATGIPSQIASRMGIQGGVRIGEVIAGSPAQKAGIQVGDVVTSFDGAPLDSAGSLLADVCALSPGATVPVTFVHAKQTVHAVITVAAQPQE